MESTSIKKKLRTMNKPLTNDQELDVPSYEVENGPSAGKYVLVLLEERFNHFMSYWIQTQENTSSSHIPDEHTLTELSKETSAYHEVIQCSSIARF